MTRILYRVPGVGSGTLPLSWSWLGYTGMDSGYQLGYSVTMTSEECLKLLVVLCKTLEDRPDLAQRLGQMVRKVLAPPRPKRDRAAYMRAYRARAT